MQRICYFSLAVPKVDHVLFYGGPPLPEQVKLDLDFVLVQTAQPGEHLAFSVDRLFESFGMRNEVHLLGGLEILVDVAYYVLNTSYERFGVWGSPFQDMGDFDGGLVPPECVPRKLLRYRAEDFTAHLVHGYNGRWKMDHCCWGPSRAGVVFEDQRFNGIHWDRFPTGHKVRGILDDLHELSYKACILVEFLTELGYRHPGSA